uniref:Uncharacterized protein n=1 Tax=Anguilla anguilla TaxID=7936 RepID=A0A0E9UAT7_ANGAN
MTCKSHTSPWRPGVTVKKCDFTPPLSSRSREEK